MKKKKIKHQDILEPSCQPSEQIADVVWLEKPKPKIKNKILEVEDAITKSIKKRINKKNN